MGIARLEILESEREHDRLATMAADVRAGLGTAPRSIPPKYFYDDDGSRLFDAICDLDEYYLTRAERALLDRYAADIVACIGPPDATALVEIGSGLARKTGVLVRALCARAGSTRYVPFDISPEAIAVSAQSLLPEHPGLSGAGRRRRLRARPAAHRARRAALRRAAALRLPREHHRQPRRARGARVPARHLAPDDGRGIGSSSASTS